MKEKLFLLLTLVSFCSFSQNSILKDLDKKAKYEFYISASQNVVRENNKESNDFIYADQTVIQNIIKTWQGKNTNGYLKCGYNYRVYIINENKIVESILINDECNQLVYSKGAANIKVNPFSNLNSVLKFSSFTFKAISKAEAILFLASIKDLNDVYCGNCDNYDFTDLKEDEFDGDYNLYIFGKSENILKLSNSH
jgi:hypothetical protein